MQLQKIKKKILKKAERLIPSCGNLRNSKNNRNMFAFTVLYSS